MIINYLYFANISLISKVEAYCSAEGKHIVGYYQANHHIENSRFINK